MKKLFKNKPLMMEILRFAIVGGVATLVDLAVSSLFQYIIYTSMDKLLLLGFIAVTKSVLVSTLMGFTFGVIVNYVLSILVVFIDVENKKTSRSIVGFLAFVGLSFIGFIINLGIKELGNLIIPFNQNFFWFLVVFGFATLVVLVYNYISRKLLLFKPKKVNKEQTDNEKDL